MITKIIKLNLSLFDGGEGGAGTATSAEGGFASQTSSNDEQKVVYGKQDSSSQVASGNGAQASGDLNAEFESLIKGKYKDVYGQRVQDAITQRFKNQQDLSAEIESYNEALAPIYSRYGVTVGDYEALNDAFMNDDDLFEEEAAQRGLSVEQLKYIKNLEAENEKAEKIRQEIEAQHKADEDYAEWISQAESMKDKYPQFNLRAEVQNDRFLNLLDNGWTVEEAYKAVHVDDLLTDAVGTAASNTRRMVTDNIAARGMRPAENGVGSKSGVIVKDDPSKYTDDDIVEILKRVKQGEKIRL